MHQTEPRIRKVKKMMGQGDRQRSAFISTAQGKSKGKQSTALQALSAFQPFNKKPASEILMLQFQQRNV